MDFPSYAELLRRIAEADDVACNGGFQDGSCSFCKKVVELLRGGDLNCQQCGHINVLHNCELCQDYDSGKIELEELTDRMSEWQTNLLDRSENLVPDEAE